MTVENARRHGHADPRFTARPRLRLIIGGDAPAIDGVELVVREPRRLTLTEADDDVSAELEWPAFGERFFPDRRLHDFEAVKAYAAYRATGLVRAVSAAIP